MKKAISYRTVDEWKSALMTLPGSSFFELLRSVLGNIKTPFSKQKLLNDLLNLLSRDDIKETIVAYLNEQDQMIIAAVALLGEPVPEDLDDFFSGELSPEDIQALVINLEERLIIYRLRTEGALRLALNPVLEQVLAPFIANTQRFFISYKDEGSQEEHAGSGNPDDRIVAALFTFIRNEKELFKAEARGTELSGQERRKIRKKILDKAKRFFPDLDFDLAVRTSIRLGLLRQDGSALFPCSERVASYCALSADERQEYWTAGMYFCLYEQDSGASPEDIHIPWFSWTKLKQTASFIHSFRDLIEPGRLYPEITLKRIGRFLESEGDKLASPLFIGKVQPPFENILKLMEMTGLLVKKEDYWKKSQAVLPLPSDPEKPVIAMDTVFSFVLYPEISFADAMELGVFCSLKENTETAVCFEITRQTAARGFDQGLGAAAMVSLLERLSHNRLDANLSWTLNEWESRYMGVSVHQGIVLNLAEDRRYLAEAKPVLRLIRKTLAPGVYLLSSDEKADAVKALAKAGVDIVAQPPLDANTGEKIESSKHGVYSGVFQRLGSSIAESNDLISIMCDNAVREDTASSLSADSIKKNFREALVKIQHTKQERDELLARIERSLILSEAQLEASVRYEKLEARGLDYTGKSMIAKQAIESGSLVEVLWSGLGGEINRTIGIPQTLEKQEGDSILILQALKENNAVVFRIPLGKISLLRRIKQSIFGE